jgi:D-cysteine desulfhydrase
VIGHFLATLELATQLDAPPDTIVTPLGTGSTAAGIALGVAWLGWSTRTVAVRVASWLVANRWRTVRLARKASSAIRQAGLEFNVPGSSFRLDVVNAIGAGYGHPTRDGERARALAAEHGLRLDPTYGAKAFTFLQRREPQIQRAVFWQTFPSF